MLALLFWHAAACIRDIKANCIGILQTISHSDRTCLSKFNSIDDKIGNQLYQTILICIKGTFRQTFGNSKSNSFFFQAKPHALFDFFHRLVDIYQWRAEVKSAGFDFGHVQNIIDQLKKQVGICFDDVCIFAHLLTIFYIRQHIREADNRIQRSADFMTHISQKGGFQLIRLLRLFHCLTQTSVCLAKNTYIIGDRCYQNKKENGTGKDFNTVLMKYTFRFVDINSSFRIKVIGNIVGFQHRITEVGTRLPSYTFGNVLRLFSMQHTVNNFK